MKGRFSGKRENGKAARKFLAVLMVAIMLVSPLLVISPEQSSAGTVNASQSYTVTYYPNGASTGSATTANYHGIISTEYNPEYWAGSSENLNNATNWVGPSYTATVDCTVNVAAAESSTEYTIERPSADYEITGYSVVSGSVSTSTTFPASSFTFTTKDAATIIVKLQYTEYKVFAGWTEDIVVISGDQLYTVEPSDAVDGVINLVPYYVDDASKVFTVHFNVDAWNGAYDVSVVDGTRVKLPDAPAGDTPFKYWSVGGNPIEGDYYLADADDVSTGVITITPVYAISSEYCTVTLHDSRTDTSTPIKALVGDYVPLPNITEKKDNKQFIGWYCGDNETYYARYYHVEKLENITMEATWSNSDLKRVIYLKNTSTLETIYTYKGAQLSLKDYSWDDYGELTGWGNNKQTGWEFDDGGTVYSGYFTVNSNGFTIYAYKTPLKQYTVKYGADTVQAYTRGDVEVPISIGDHVYAGWTFTGNILPGDVVPCSTQSLYATWIEPDIFVKDISVSSANTTVAITAPTPYMPLYLASDGALNVSKTGYTQTRGDQRTEDSMYGTIYGFTTSNTYYCGTVELPTGTYRSKIGFAKLNCGNVGESQGDIYLGGNVIMDNFDMKSKTWNGKNGGIGGAKFGLFANGHILIMGTGITNSGLRTNYDLIPMSGSNGGQATWQIVGGTYDTAITAPIQEEKRMVFADGREYLTDIATCVIIHSGTYYNLTAGSYMAYIGAFDKASNVRKDTILSTYMVLKGGMVGSSVNGGGFKGTVHSVPGKIDKLATVDSEMVGGSFIYATGIFLPGDQYEDNATGDLTGIRGSVRVPDTSTISGGCNQSSNLSGSSHVFVTDNASIFDVQGGGREQSSRTSFAYLEISGNSTVRHLACGTIMNGNPDNKKNDLVGSLKISVSGDAKVANVLGAGYDIWYNPSGRSMLSGKITIEMSGGTVGNIYGGGFRGSIGTDDDPDLLHIDITVSGGTVLQNVYGGGSGGVDKVKHRATDGSDIYTGSPGFVNSSGSSDVHGTITVNIEGGTINGSVYGGGMSVPKIYSYKGTKVDQSGDTSTVADVYGPVTVNVSGGTINGSVYGGGKGIEFTETEDGFVIEDTAEIQLMRSTPNGEGEYLIEIDWFKGSGSTYYYGMIWPKGNNESEADYNTRVVKAKSYLDKDENSYSGYYLDSAKVYGNVTVKVTGGTIGGSVYGGGANGKVGSNNGTGGNIIVDITKEENNDNELTINGSVFGGGLGLEGVMAVEGTRSVRISNGTINGSVYGGSSIGNDGIDSSTMVGDGDLPDKKSNALVVLEEATIAGSVYGGGFKGITWGNTEIYIGYDYSVDNDGKYSRTPYTGDEDKPISLVSVYAGGSISDRSESEGGSGEEEASDGSSEIQPFSTSLVMGKGDVYIYGNGSKGKITITGSIMGSGNSCKTEGKTTLTMTYFDNRAEEMTGIHRFDEVSMSHSSLTITGRDTLTPVAGHQSKILSLFEIGSLELSNESAIWISNPADHIGSIKSLNKDGMNTTVSAPSNKIVYEAGITIYIRAPDQNDRMVYGTVTGYIMLAVKEQGSYGAYVLGNPNSHGGFVIMKDGTYKEADSSIFSDDVECWFLSGIEKKIATMKLPYVGEGVESMVDATVDVVKLQNDTTMRYTGATFTTVTTDYDGTPFEFVRPGTETDDNEFGLIIGYDDGTADTGTTMFSQYQRYLDLGSGNQWVTGSYYATDEFGNMLVESDEVYKTDEGNTDKTRKVPLAPVNLRVDPAAGTYALNFRFTGLSSNHTMYVGYLTLNFQEIQEISYTSSDENGDYKLYTNTMVVNKVEVTIYLYVVGTGGDNIDYEVLLRTQNSNGKAEGYTEVLIPTSSDFVMANIYLAGAEVDGSLLKDGSYIDVKAEKNQDNTTGWMSTAGSVRWTKDEGSVHKDIGTMMGTVVSTLRISVSNFEYKSGISDDPYFRLHFVITSKDGTNSDAYVKVNIKERNEWEVHFIDSLYEMEDVITVPDGTTISPSSHRSMGSNFVGWYTDENYENQFDYSIPITKNTTLYARYAFVVTFDNMDGTSSQMYVPAEKTNTLLDENLVPRPTRTGYVFERWCKDSSCTIGWNYAYDTISDNNTRLYAKWGGEDIAVIFHYDSGSGSGYSDIEYRITVGNEELYPTVYYGATFSTVDTTNSSKNILDVAKEKTECTKFLYWKTYTGTGTPTMAQVLSGSGTVVYSDTILTSKMVKLGTTGDSGMTEVHLYAVTSDVAMEMTMNKNTDDLSAVISAPYKYLIYPNGGTTKTDPMFKTNPDTVTLNDVTYFKDKLGNLYAQPDPSAIAIEHPYKVVENRYKIDDSGFSIYVPGTAKPYSCGEVEGYYYYLGKTSGGTKYELDLENGTYVPEGGDPVVITWTETPESSGIYIDQCGCEWAMEDGDYILTVQYVFKEEENSYRIQTPSGTPSYFIMVGEDDYVPCAAISGYYFKDVYGNHYSGSAGNYSVIYEDGSHYSDVYYEFSFTLNDASRSGWRLINWHNESMEENPLYPGPGITRIIKLFVKEVNGNTVVTAEALETTDKNGKVDVYRTQDYSAYAENNLKRIDDASSSNNYYKVQYDAQWGSLNYTLTISGSAHGTVDAFLVKSDGSRELITGSRSDLVYGQQVELLYTPEGNYTFNQWNTSGECTIENSKSSSTTLVVKGDCAVSVTDTGDRVVKIYIQYDNGLLNSRDKELTNLFIYNNYTHEYIQMRYVSSQGDSEVYREYVPLSRSADENYDVYVRYGTESDYEEYKLYGDSFNVYLENDLNFHYHIISGRIVESVVYTEDGVKKVDRTIMPSGFTYDVNHYVDDKGYDIYPTKILDSQGNVVVKIAKYVGVSDDYLNPDAGHIDEIINNPENGFPPVYIYIAPGYEYLTYEGFPHEEEGIAFDLDEEDNYYIGVSDGQDNTRSRTVDPNWTIENSVRKQFDLNWTQTGKPAYVIVHLYEIEYDINYSHDSNATTDQVSYGESLMPSGDVMYALGNPTNIAGWFYDSEKKYQVLGHVLDKDSIAKLKPSPAPIPSQDSEFTLVEGDTYEDKYGNRYTRSGLQSPYTYTLTESHVYKTVENRYRMNNGQYQMYVEYSQTSKWIDCDAVSDCYYRDASGEKTDTQTGDSFFKAVENEYVIIPGATPVYKIKINGTYEVTDSIYNYHYKDSKDNYYMLDDGAYTCISVGSTECTLYSKVSENSLKTIKVGVWEQNIGDDGYTMITAPVSFTLESNAGYYEGTFSITDIPGFSPYGSDTLSNLELVTVGFTGTAQFSLVKNNSDLTGIYIKVTFPENYPDDTLEVKLKFDRKTATLTYNPNTGSVVSGDWASNPMTVRYGSAIVLPTVSKAGHPFVEWTTTSGSVDVADGVYSYTVGPDDSSVTFTAQYQPDTYKLTFITSLGSYRTFGSSDSGSQRVTLIVNPGTTVQKSIDNEKIKITIDDTSDTYYEVVVPSSYSFGGFDVWDCSTSYSVTADTTFVAKWTATLHTFTYSGDSGCIVSASSSSSEISSGGQLSHHSEVTVYIQLLNGNTLDVVATKAASTTYAGDGYGNPVRLDGVDGYSWSFFLDMDIDFEVVTAGPSVKITFIVNGEEKDDVSTIEWIKLDNAPTGTYYKIGNDRYTKVSEGNYEPISSAPQIAYNYEVQTVTDSKGVDYYIDNFGSWFTRAGESEPYTYTLCQDHVYNDDDSGSEYIDKIVEGQHNWYKKGTDHYGRNLPLYSMVTFDNYNGGDIGWYTDPSFKDQYLYTPTVTGDFTVYTSDSKKDLTLYSYSGRYMLNLHDYDGSLTRNIQVPVVVDGNSKTVTIGDEYRYGKSGYVFVGWAVKENGSNVFKYVPGDKIPVDSDSGTIDLYAYYLKTAAGSRPYDSLSHEASVVCVTTELGQTAIAADKIVMYYSSSMELNHDNYTNGSTTAISMSEVGSIEVNYYGIVTSSTGKTHEFGSKFTSTIDKLIIYLIAPSKSMEEGTAASLSASDNEIIVFTSSSNHEIPSELIGVEIGDIKLDTRDGYEKSINQVGKVYTGVAPILLNNSDSGNYELIYYEGTLTIYKKGSSVYGYGGY